MSTPPLQPQATPVRPAPDPRRPVTLPTWVNVVLVLILLVSCGAANDSTPTPPDAGEVASQVVQQLQSELASRRSALAAAQSELASTREKLAQARQQQDDSLTRLLENAIAYGAAPYVVEGTVADGDLRLVVEDEGRGVDSDFAPRLFEPYARSEPSRRVPGVGLGLWTARQLARARGGDIVYEAPAEGGARFVVTLPVHGSRFASRSVGSRMANLGGGLRASPRYLALSVRAA